MRQYRADAERLIAYLRSDNAGDFTGNIYALRTVVKNGNLTLADIGTTEDELGEILTKFCKSKAQRKLNCLREGSRAYDEEINILRQCLEEGNLSLADIGITEEDLENLRLACCKNSAQVYLSWLRKGTNDSNMPVNRFLSEYLIDSLREDLKNGRLSLAAINTSEEELVILKDKFLV